MSLESNLVLAHSEDCSCILGSCSSRDCYKRHEDSGSVKFRLLYLQNVLFPMVCKGWLLFSPELTGYISTTYMLIECSVNLQGSLHAAF